MDWIVEVGKQVPALAIMGFVVVKFIAYIESRDMLLKDLGDDCHRVQREATKVIKENGHMLGEVSTLLRKLNSTTATRLENQP